MTPHDIEWCDPPPKGNTRLRDFVDVLKTRPGEWAKYPHPITRETVRNSASKNRTKFPGTEWAHSNGQLYGRWVGE